MSLFNPTDQPVTVHYQTADGTATVADNDYVPASGTLTIPAKNIQGTITIQVVGDTKFEDDETFFVNLSSPTNATIADGKGQGTIENDDQTADAPEAPVTEFALSRIVPNPTQGSARVDYTVAQAARVRLTIVDLQGRLVATLHDGVQPAGRYQTVWNGENALGRAPVGMYFVRYQAAGKNAVKRLMLTR